MTKDQKYSVAFSDAVNHVASNISQYTIHPGQDLTRSRKLGPDKLLTFLVSCGWIELLDFFGLRRDSPSASAFNQQRAKLKPEALETVSSRFNSSLLAAGTPSAFRLLAADGSTFTFFSRPEFSPSEYFVSEGHSAKGFYSMHLNDLYDLQKHTYSDTLIQPVHQKDEFRAFCDMADRHGTLPGTRDVFIGDRMYCSYNNMTHVYRVFLRPATEKDPIDVMSLLKKSCSPFRRNTSIHAFRRRIPSDHGILYTEQHRTVSSIYIISFCGADVNLFICHADIFLSKLVREDKSLCYLSVFVFWPAYLLFRKWDAPFL